MAEEDCSGEISRVFEEIKEKPTFDAARIGRLEAGKVTQIKVSPHTLQMVDIKF